MPRLLHSLLVGGVAAGVAHASLNIASLANNTVGATNAVLEAEDAKKSKQIDPLEEGLAFTVDKLWVQGDMERLMFRPDASFEDPMARCEGWHEVSQAFRGAKQLRGGKQLSPAYVTPTDSPTVFVVHLHHEYCFFNHDVEMRSHVMMELDGIGQIAHVEWHWFGVPLLNWKAVKLARRINGIFSYIVTPFILPV
mmetsp:Transcript_24978/g.47254  ORF Transcript_24978/g.47254 Transcript_24978/m.47254 type:complete len:195 (+) Transcript_24978:236-820(+)|eukprot:CAMPEP_0114255306 /NCGR_PEP_ID=MMETSP0058-20121206/17481_1 /TAXON_ID=36894 /ORGANISM="Pyramimonas parkeae, CCMP726" /LENGTH=194 /DNA_ID=CAMNT_0001369661 /DNA_START=236 /DNA_END=820 /DNA_ORIENTATION=+